MVVLSPARIGRLFVFGTTLVIVAGTIANFCIYHVVESPQGNVADVFKRFDLGHEPSIPQFFSALGLVTASALLYMIGRFERRDNCRDRYYWYGMAIVFFGLAVDESVMFHEMVDTALGLVFEPKGVFYFPWVIAGVLFAGVFAVIFVPFVARKSKRTVCLFALAGTVFLTGAVGMEMIASLIFENAGSDEAGVMTLSHTLVQSLEELLEMLGIVLFIFALLDYLANHHPFIELYFSDSHRRVMDGIKHGS